MLGLFVKTKWCSMLKHTYIKVGGCYIYIYSSNISEAGPIVGWLDQLFLEIEFPAEGAIFGLVVESLAKVKKNTTIPLATYKG